MKKNIVSGLFFRSFFLQTLWNFERLQNIGFLYIIYPVIAGLYKDKEKRKQALLKHIGFFNTNPYMASVIIAMVVTAEQNIAEGKPVSVKPEVIKSMMAGPVAAIGDSFFWGTWRPFVSFVAIFLSILLINIFDINYLWIVPVWFIVLYNIVHLAFRYWALSISFSLNEKMIELISKLEISFIGDVFRSIGLVIIVAALAFYVYSFGFGPTTLISFINYDIPEAIIFGLILLITFLFGNTKPVILFYCALVFSFIFAYLGL